ncbi:hypothetical protein GCM10009756_09790 [Pseudokineococcus marinus]
MQDFPASAQRHHSDGASLLAGGRHETADHLFGFSAECSLKAILTGLGGVPTPVSGPPTQGATRFGHLPHLWDTSALYLQGRALQASPTQMTSLMSGANPFARWNVNQRYESGTVSSQQAATHEGASKALLNWTQASLLAGVLL